MTVSFGFHVVFCLVTCYYCPLYR